jgi:glycosyltransferase involved in cell wall biosynthesis
MTRAVPSHSESAPNPTLERPLRVAWFPYFPIEWLPDLPPELQGLTWQHPATWQRVLWEEFKKYPQLKLDILIPRSQFGQTHVFERDGTRFHCIRTPRGLRFLSLFWWDTLVIRRELKRIRPDLVHAWGTEFGGAAIAGRLNYPALVTMQGILTWYGSVFPLNRHMRLSRFLEPGSLRHVRITTCESRFGMHYLADRYPHLKLLQVEHAPNPIFSRVQRHPQQSPKRILCVGAFVYWKGADVVFKALEEIEADFEVVWAGAGNMELENSLRAQVSAEIWSKVTFKHDLPPEKIAEELARATVLVHAARADNSPNSVKEAVVAGVPVIATNTGGIPDYVISGKNGFLFESGDFQDCRAKIRTAFEHPLFSKGAVDPGTLEEMRRYLSAETMARKFYAAYLETLRTYRVPGLNVPQEK